MRVAWVILGLAFCFNAGAANGRFLSEVCEAAIKLRAEPSNGQLLFANGYCFGAVGAVRDFIEIASGEARQRSGLCGVGRKIPDDAAVWAVVSYLREHPEGHEKPSTELIANALKLAFPCP
jgi:hypothetical protein